MMAASKSDFGLKRLLIAGTSLELIYHKAIRNYKLDGSKKY